MTIKNQIYISILIFFLLALLLFFSIIFPFFKKIKAGIEELELLRQRTTFFETRLNNIEKLKKANSKIEDFLEKAKNVFVKKDAPIEFISFLEKIAKDCEVFIKIVPVEKQITENKNAIHLQILVISSFPKISCFLEKLESGQYLIEVLGLEFSKLTEGDLKTKEFGNFSLGDVKGIIFFRVLSK